MLYGNSSVTIAIILGAPPVIKKAFILGVLVGGWFTHRLLFGKEVDFVDKDTKESRTTDHVYIVPV